MNESDADNNQGSKVTGLVFLSLLLIGLVYGGWFVSKWLEDEQRAPIQQIMVTGERRYIDDAEIEKLIRENHPGSFFMLDVEKVHQDLEAMPWIYRASVRKRWPNSLTVFVVEQKPIAIWNGDMLLNEFGESFPGTVEDQALPELFGPGGSEKTALQGYKEMMSLINVDLWISELTLSERYAWNVRMNNGMKLNLGRIQFNDRLQRFIDVLPVIQKQNREVDYIDLRYDTGLAVGWKSEQNKKQES